MRAVDAGCAPRRPGQRIDPARAVERVHPVLVGRRPRGPEDDRLGARRRLGDHLGLRPRVRDRTRLRRVEAPPGGATRRRATSAIATAPEHAASAATRRARDLRLRTAPRRQRLRAVRLVAPPRTSTKRSPASRSSAAPQTRAGVRACARLSSSPGRARRAAAVGRLVVARARRRRRRSAPRRRACPASAPRACLRAADDQRHRPARHPGPRQRRHEARLAAVERDAQRPQRDERLRIDVLLGPVLRRADRDREVEVRRRLLDARVAQQADDVARP